MTRLTRVLATIALGLLAVPGHVMHGIGMVVDPEGNHLELIQPAPRG